MATKSEKNTAKVEKTKKPEFRNMLLKLPIEVHEQFKYMAESQKKTLSGLLEGWVVAKAEKKAAKAASK